ncbi:MAG: DUF1624 domain-containing protein [Burkholderiales bacterium]|nr:DUF1624 domain-containing protein [Burkholderiales bacterium]
MAKRIPLVDAARGFAAFLMILYHFCFDLNYFGLLHQDFNTSPFWLSARAFIVSLFLTLSGISLVLASDRGTRHALIRLVRLLAASIVVTLGSYLMFPQSFIFFGILHFILVASLIGMFFLKFYRANLIFGMIILAFGLAYSNPVFDAPYLQWIGLMTHKPYTEDYVPLFPWMGMVLIGMFLGKLLFEHLKPQWLWGYAPAMKFPALLGRHSLAVYLLHQPILIGILYLIFGH